MPRAHPHFQRVGLGESSVSNLFAHQEVADPPPPLYGYVSGKVCGSVQSAVRSLQGGVNGDAIPSVVDALQLRSEERERAGRQVGWGGHRKV